MAEERNKIEFDDPHVQIGPMEAETTRIRKLRGFWQVLLATTTALTILLCINQQFGLRFFVGFTPLNTEYFYLLILFMLPFTFLIFPGSSSASLDRIPWYDIALFLLTAAGSLYLMFQIRRAAELGWEFGGAPDAVIWAGYAMWIVLMEALRRTGGWSLLLSILPFTVYPLFAASSWLGPLRSLARRFPGRAGGVALLAFASGAGQSSVYQFTAQFLLVHRGWNPGQYSLLVLTAGIGALTILPGRATLQEGGLHLVIFGAFLLLAVNP